MTNRRTAHIEHVAVKHPLGQGSRFEFGYSSLDGDNLAWLRTRRQGEAVATRLRDDRLKTTSLRGEMSFSGQSLRYHSGRTSPNQWKKMLIWSGMFTSGPHGAPHTGDRGGHEPKCWKSQLLVVPAYSQFYSHVGGYGETCLTYKQGIWMPFARKTDPDPRTVRQGHPCCVMWMIVSTK